MITEDYVSFETAKLLKEKGFDCEKNSITAMYNEIGKFLSLSTSTDEYYDYSDFNEYDYVAPTLQMVMKWLREKHNLVVNPVGHYSNGVIDKWESDIYTLDSGIDATYNASGHIYGETYEDAAEAAIRYCLEKLI